MTALLALPDIAQVAEAFLRGSIGSANAFFSATLVRAIPLTLVGVAVAIAFRAGVFNIGAEGQLLLGAVAATIVGLYVDVGIAAIPLAMIAAAIAGGGWAAIAAILRARFGVLEVISTIMLNFVAGNLVSYLVRGPLQEPTRVYPQTEPVLTAAQLPQLWGGTRLHAGIFLAVGACVAAWWILGRTAGGFRICAVGASATVSVVTGRIDATRVTTGVFVASGAIAGIAGGVEITGVTYALYENLSPGFGFSAIAVAILARLHPLWIPLSALLFAILEAGALGMQRDAGVPSVVALALEGLVILAVVAASGIRSPGLWSGVARSAPALEKA
ncbi:MAG TPA: ABC transporter permease [Gemmatimonadaceae bacterium]|nr:ABC transporter permease [Gemmatimonadaceae bacterium]